MRLNHIIISVLFIGTLVLTGCSSSRKAAKKSATTSMVPSEVVAEGKTLSPNDQKKILESAISHYAPWQSVALEGKFSMEGMPLDPSVKIYMEKDRSILISLRVPVIGEVTRVEIADGEILLANRMKKVYFKENLDRVLSKVDMTIADVQDLLLGRIFLLGGGTLTAADFDKMQVSKAASNYLIVTPLNQPGEANYGFTLGSDYNLDFMFAGSTDDRYIANVEYIWKDARGKKDVELMITVDEMVFTPMLSFNAPVFNAKPMERMSMGKGWTQVSIGKFLKSF